MGCNVIFADPTAGAAAFFGSAGNSAINYIQGAVDNFCSQVGAANTHIADIARQQFHNVTQGDFARRVEAIRGKMDTLWQTDSIRAISQMRHIQQVQPTMARWVMANPRVRRMYLNSRVDGYDEDTYLDNDPNSAAGAGSYDFDVITSGVVQHTVNDEGDRTQFIRHAVNNRYDEEYTVTMQNKLDVAHTWHFMEQAMEMDNTDPTSRTNGTIR